MPKLEKSQIILLVILSVFLFFWKLDSTYLTNWDEAWYASIARNMAKSGDYITPIYNGKIWFAASPLYLWLEAIWFKLFGVSEFGTRFFSALSSVGSIILIYLIGKKLFSRNVGIIAGLVLTSSIQFLYRGRTGNLDATLTFFITLAIFAFLKARKKPKWYAIFGLSCAFAFLTKGVFGLLLLPLFLFMPKRFRLTTFLVFLLTILPWHFMAFVRHGQGFIDYYFKQYMFSKASVANPVSGTDIFWYIGAFKHGLKIWFLFLFPALLFAFYKAKKNKNLRYLLLWFLLPFLILTLARMRNDWYLIFLYPAAALIIGYFLEKIGKATKNSVVFTIVAMGVVFNLYRYQSFYIVPETVAAEVTLASLAKSKTSKTETILLDDNYLPVAVFYSDRLVVPLRYSRAKEALVSDQSLKATTQGAKRKLVLTNIETISQLINRLNNPDYEVLKKADDKILIEINFN